MCYIDTNRPGPGQILPNVFENYFIGPGWMSNDTQKIALISCEHRSGKIDALHLKPGEVLHLEDDVIRLEIKGLLPLTNQE